MNLSGSYILGVFLGYFVCNVVVSGNPDVCQLCENSMIFAVFYCFFDKLFICV